MLQKGKEVKGWTAFQMIFSSQRQSSTGSVVVTATCATSPLSQITRQTKRGAASMQHGRSDDALGVDLRTRVKKLDVEKCKEKEVQGEIFDHQEELGLPEKSYEGGGQEATSGHGASKDVESACSGDGSYGEI